MKLVQTTVKNYRCHRDLTVSFSPDLTVIEGANETGKSTLMEAVHRGLFLRSKVTGQVLDTMRSDRSGHPEVEVVFETGAKLVSVRKWFSGPRGTTSLTVAGEGVLKDEQAEARLAEILGVQGMVGGVGAQGVLEKRWAHLWVVQGRSGLEPTGDLGEVGAALVDRLQAMGGGAAVQSSLDRKIREKVRQQVEGMVKGSGDEPRANTRWAELRAAVERLKETRNRLEGEVRSLEDAMTQKQEADRRLAELEPRIARAVAERDENRAKREKITELRTAKKEVEGEIKIKEGEHQRVVKQLTELAEAEAAIPQLEKMRAGAEGKVAEARGALKLVQEQVREAEAAMMSAEAARDGVRCRRDLSLAREACQRAQNEVARLEQVRAEIAEAGLHLAELRRRLDALPNLTAAGLKQMEELRAQKMEAEAAERAVAAGVRVLQACAGLKVGEHEVRGSQELRFAGPFDIRVNGQVHLQVTPGGGSSLEEAVAAKERTSAALRDLSERLGVISLEAAREALVQRQVLEQEVKAEEKRLKAAGAEEIEQMRQKAAAELGSARVRLAALESAVKEVGDGPDDDAALREAEALFQRRQAEHKALEERLAGVLERSKQAEVELREIVDQQRDAVTRRDTLVSAAGTKDVLSKRQAELEAGMTALRTRALSQTEELERLGADFIGDQVEMSERAVEGLLKEAEGWRLTQAKSHALLIHNGSHDPFSELTEVQGELAMAEKALGAEEMRVRGWRRLLELFEEEEARLEKQFTGPLVSCVEGYLAPVFGPKSKVTATYQEGRFSGLLLDRSGSQQGTFSYEALSAGTREQLGVAFRLAVAEVLAARHDGSLPMVLDDAFVNSDPDRLSKLRLMLHRATKQGLQIILITCSPGDYSSLGATIVHLGDAGARQLP